MNALCAPFSGDQQIAELVGGLGAGLDGAGAGTRSTRMASTIPLRALGVVVASSASTARAAASASMGSDLPRRRRRWRLGRSTSTTVTPAWGEVAGKAGAVGARPLHPGPDEATVTTGPGHQLVEAGGGHWDGQRAQWPAELVQQAGDVDLGVGIDAEDDLCGLICHGGGAPGSGRTGAPPAGTADRTLRVPQPGSWLVESRLGREGLQPVASRVPAVWLAGSLPPRSGLAR